MTSDRLWVLARVIAVIAYICVEVVLGATDTPTSDELRHLRDGATVLAAGSVAVNPEHPPLVKVLSALVLPSAGRRAALAVATGDPMTADTRFCVSLRLVGKNLLLARLPAIIIASLGLVTFGSLFARRSARLAFVSTLALGAATPFLAHGHYVTTDVAPITLGLLTVWALASFRGRWAVLLGGAFLGAFLLTKFSAPLVFPFLLAFAVLRWKGKKAAAVGIVSLILAFFVETWAVRGMTRADLTGLADRAFVHGGLGGPAPPSNPLARSSAAIIALSPPVAAYWIGFWDVAHRSSTAEWVDYWMGKVVSGPQPLYPIATLAFKDDLPFLLLALFGAIVSVRRRSLRLPTDTWLAVGGGLFYFGLACRSSLHLGIRYLLPLVVLLAGAAAMGFEGAGRTVRSFVLWPLLFLHLLTATLAFPYFTSSRNLLSRLFLPKDAAYDLSDDWGQDLGRFLKHHREPVVYLTFLPYRVRDWQELFPELHPLPCATCTHILVDQVTLDLLAASTSPGRSPVARQALNSIRPLLTSVAAVCKEGRPIPIREPTLRLFSR